MAAPSRVSASSKDGGGPSVLVLIVATNGERWLPDALKSLKAQGHKPLEILAVDNASEDGSKAILTKALGAKRVVRLDRRVGYGRAVASGVKVAAERAIPTDALLLLHDDAALQPGALDLMLAALKGDRVGVVGAKLVEWDDPSRLQDVGGTTDRYGRMVPRVERGELDQGQHAGVHEVLFVSSAALLVSADVVERVGLFDLRYVALRDDFDFCWRARLAGFRVLVVADAAARHASAGYRQVRDSPVRGRVRYFSDRNMIASLIKNYGLVRLLVRLPVTLLISILNALFFLVSGRRRAALQAVEAVQWNLVHLPSTLRARLRTQSRRVVSDREITRLMVRGFPQLRAQLQQVVERVVGEVEEGEEEAVDRPRPRLRERLAARRVGLLWMALAILYLVGAHGVLRSGALSGADMPPFRGAQELFSEFFSGWRSVGTGAAAPATPGLVLLGLLTYACLGSAWLAQRVLVLGLPLAAGAFMWRLATAASLDAAPRRAAAIAYALSPLGLSALGVGRLSDLLLYAAAPALVLPLLRAAGLVPRGAAAAWRSAAAGALGLAATASLAPWALCFVLGAGVVVAAASLTVAHGRAALAALRRTAVMVVGAAVLLLPWTVELFRDPSPVGIGGSARGARMRELLGLHVGDVRPVPLVLSYGLPLAAVAGAALAVRVRRDLARALLVAAALSALAGWAVARGVPWIAPRPAQPLVLAAVAVALATGIALDGVRPALAEREFGWRHVAIPVLAALAVVELGAAVAWVARGDRPGIVRSGDLQPAFLAAEERRLGDFRVLWVAGTRGSLRVALAAPTGVTMAAYAARAGGPGADALRATVAAIASGATDAGGRALGTFGVRYVIARPETEPAVIDALARQTALRFVQRFHGATVFRNDAAIPVAASIAARGWVRASRTGLAATAGVEPAPAAGPGFRRTAPGAFDGRSARRGRLLVLAQDFGNWSAVAAGKPVAAERSFAWATAFRISGAHPVAVRWRGQGWHRLALAGELVLLLVFASAWSRTAARERGER